MKLAAGFLLALAFWLQTVPGPHQITVSAAVSLTDALTEATEAYGNATGGDVRFNYAASNVLARQIVDGAPVDVFISADEAQMDVVQHAGLLKPGTRVDLLGNQLAVVVAPDRPHTFASMRDLTGPVFRHIAIGDPAGVPAGVYAQKYLEAAGLWSALASRIVPTVSVRAALAAVETGAADAAIVYRTDARISTRATIAWVVSAQNGPRIVYPAAVVSTTRAPDAAQRFLDFLRGAAAWRTFEGFGFSKPR